MWTNWDSQKLLGGMENSAATLENNLLKKLKIHLSGDSRASQPPCCEDFSSRDVKETPACVNAPRTQPGQPRLQGWSWTWLQERSVLWVWADQVSPSWFRRSWGLWNYFSFWGISGNVWHDGSASGTIPSYRIIFRNLAGLLCFANFVVVV